MEKKKKKKKIKIYVIAERSFDLRTSGLWAQHASTAPLCFLPLLTIFLMTCIQEWLLIYFLFFKKITILPEVGFEPTPTSVDCDLNAAP